MSSKKLSPKQAEAAERDKLIRQVKHAARTLNTALPKLYGHGVVCWVTPQLLSNHVISPHAGVVIEMKGYGLNNHKEADDG